MPTSDHVPGPGSADGRRFATTRWSLVAAAGQKSSPEAHEALATLCQVYWYPLYAYARRHLPTSHDAQDLTQAFFVQILEKDYLQAADPQRGRFRAFLLTAFKNFLAKERERAHAQKRGGGRPLLALDFQVGEHRYLQEPVDHTTAESLYQRRWALALLEQTLARLRQEFAAVGKEKQFECLKGALAGEGLQQSYALIAGELAISESAVKVSVYRLRRRYQELLRAAIAETVDSPEEVEEELRDLFAALQNTRS